MSIEYGANTYDTIEDEFVRETCPEELRAFEEAREEVDIFMGESQPFEDAVHDSPNNMDEQVIVCLNAYQQLTAAFKERTGLKLTLSSHDVGNAGCSGDEIDGEFWYVEDVWQLTEAGRKHAARIEQKSYVTLG